MTLLDIREMIEELCQVESGLSEWEMNFIEKMSHKHKNHWFSPNEINKIKEIYDKICQ